VGQSDQQVLGCDAGAAGGTGDLERIEKSPLGGRGQPCGTADGPRCLGHRAVDDLFELAGVGVGALEQLAGGWVVQQCPQQVYRVHIGATGFQGAANGGVGDL